MGRGRGGHLMGRQTDEEDVENAERKGRNKGRSTENKYCLLELSHHKLISSTQPPCLVTISNSIA